MKQLVRRPLAFAGITFYLFSFMLVFACSAVRLAVLFIAAALFVGAVLVSLFLKNSRGVTAAISLVLAMIILASGMSYYSYDIKPLSFDFADGGTHSIIAEAGEILSSSAYGGNQVVKLTSVDGVKVNAKAIIETEGSTFAEGTLISADVSVSVIADEYDGERLRSYMSEGILLYIAPVGAVSEKDGSVSISSVALGWSSKLQGIFCNELGYTNGGFASALLLGNKSMLDYNIKNDFIRLGVAHLLAISGIHLALIALCSAYIVEKITKSEKSGAIATIVVSVLYSFFVGLTMSVVRASVMLSVAALGKILSRRSDTLTSLAVAVTGIILVNPYSAGSVSLMLSFTSVLGIAAYQAYKNDFENRITPKFDKVLISVTIFATTLPVSWLFFDEISFISPLTNIVFIPLVSIILIMLPLLLIASPLAGLAALIAKPISLLISLCLILAENLAKIKRITLSTSLPSFVIVAVIVTIALIVSAFTDKKARRCCYATVIGAIVLMFVSVIGFRITQIGKTNAIFTTHLSADAAVVISDNKTLIIDVSDGSYSSVKPAVSAINAEGYADLDGLMLTHYHQRHIQTVRKLIRRYRLSAIYLPEPIDDSDVGIYESIAEMAENNKIEVIKYKRDGNTVVKFAESFVCVGKYTLLKRSSHPVIAFDVFADKKVRYLGGSTNETEAADILETSVYEYIVYGAHNPAYKKELQLENGIIFANVRLSADGIIKVMPDNINIYSEDAPVKISLK